MTYCFGEQIIEKVVQRARELDTTLTREKCQFEVCLFVCLFGS